MSGRSLSSIRTFNQYVIEDNYFNNLPTRYLKNNVLDECLGCCFDGAAVMSGEYSGVGARIKRRVPHATSMHCRSHNLSLAVMGKRVQNIKFIIYILKVDNSYLV